MIVIISGPSGVGKGTLVRALRAADTSIAIDLSVSVTTRKPRPTELEGVDYHFIDEDTFFQKVKNHEFLEWCEVHQNFYGTPKQPVLDAMESGNPIILEIDIQGAQKIKNTMGKSVVSIFLTPPSFEDLIERLHRRNTEQPEVIQHRLLMAGAELSAIGDYDYIVVNHDIEQMTRDVMEILHDRCREGSQKKALGGPS